MSMARFIFSFFKNRILIFIFIALYIGFAFLTYRHYGLTMDEFFVYARGKYFYTKVRGNDKFLQKGFVVNEGRNQDLLYNNSSYPALLYAVNDGETYEGYHLLNLLIAASIFYLFYEVLLYLYKKPFIALVGPVFLLFTPRFFGDIPANPKDIPFAILYFATLVVIFFSKTWNEKLRILIVGILIGLTSSIRLLGIFLLPVYFLYQLTTSFLQEKRIMRDFIINTILGSFLIFLIAFLIFIFNMPYVGADPFNHTLELLNVNKNYPWFGDILHFGKTYSIYTRPQTYLFIWILITTPLFVLVLSPITLFKKMVGEKKSIIMLVWISLLFQIFLYLVLRPVIYNGIRHYVFLIPHLVLLASISFIELLANRKFKYVVVFLVAINFFVVTKFYVSYHPYEYIYFNELVGGVKGATGNFEVDYWAASDKEALTWLSDYLTKNNIQKPKIATCSKSATLGYYLPEAKDYNNKMKKADYIVCYDGVLKNKIEKIPGSTLIHTVTRDDVPFNYVYKIEHLKLKEIKGD